MEITEDEPEVSNPKKSGTPEGKLIEINDTNLISKDESTNHNPGITIQIDTVKTDTRGPSSPNKKGIKTNLMFAVKNRGEGRGVIKVGEILNKHKTMTIDTDGPLQGNA